MVGDVEDEGIAAQCFISVTVSTCRRSKGGSVDRPEVFGRD